MRDKSLLSKPGAVRKLAAVIAVLAGAWAAPAHALRPYEGTDASVAEPGVFELELAPIGYVRRGDSRTLVIPAIVGNWGIGNDFEVVLEGKSNREMGGIGDGPRSSLVDTAFSVKHVLRHGSLQDGGTGVSVAAECGVLLPELHGESGTGATCSGIVSQRFDALTVHLNAALTRARDKANARFVGVIVEGPEAPVKPVMELTAERDNRGGRTNSLLLGAIWKKSDDLAFDVGLRRARSDGERLTELRAGLTWSYQMHH
jgi:hypothetical protein